MVAGISVVVASVVAGGVSVGVVAGGVTGVSVPAPAAAAPAGASSVVAGVPAAPLGGRDAVEDISTNVSRITLCKDRKLFRKFRLWIIKSIYFLRFFLRMVSQFYSRSVFFTG